MISLVPSWTETLIACDVNVVGRTRFCIHPQSANALPVVGGTKDLDWHKVRELRPDLLIVDREENLEWMKSESPCRVVDTHVTSLQDVASELDVLAAALGGNEAISLLANRWRQVVAMPPRQWSWGKIPAELERLRVVRLSTVKVTAGLACARSCFWRASFLLADHIMTRVDRSRFEERALEALVGRFGRLFLAICGLG